MFELTAENTLDYLRERGWIGDAPTRAEVLSGGVSNQVLRVTTPVCHFVLKQSRPQLRTRDAWFSDLDRIYREQEVMQALYPSLPSVVPEVLYVDRPNFIYAMSHAPLEAKVWKADLLDGKIDVDFGAKVGGVLGRMHQVSVDQASRFQAFRDHKVFVQLRVDPFYRRIQERRPEVAEAIEPIVAQMLSTQEALCHGDFTPKNILVHNSNFVLVDYETAHFGDPTMDLGLFLAHLLLKAVRAPHQLPEFFSLIRAFWRAYCEKVKYCPLEDLERRSIRHLGVLLLARVDGTSPVEYLAQEAKRGVVRRLGQRILVEKSESWEQVWKLCESEISLAYASGG
jgi:5-methylthioribose kinase